MERFAEIEMLAIMETTYALTLRLTCTANKKTYRRPQQQETVQIQQKLHPIKHNQKNKRKKNESIQLTNKNTIKYLSQTFETVTLIHIQVVQAQKGVCNAEAVSPRFFFESSLLNKTTIQTLGLLHESFSSFELYKT